MPTPRGLSVYQQELCDRHLGEGVCERPEIVIRK
jgi:hypothetical protein